MGAKKAQKKLDELLNLINKLSHAVGALNSCKERLEDTAKKMMGMEDQKEFDKAQETCRKVFAEMEKKWGEWPGYLKDTLKTAEELTTYCAENKKKHRLRPLLGKQLDAIAKKVEDLIKEVENVRKILGSFEASYKTWKKMLA